MFCSSTGSFRALGLVPQYTQKQHRSLCFAAAGGACLAVGAVGGSSNKVTICEESKPHVEKQAPAVCGKWRLDKSKSESMQPYLTGLGMPSFVARIIDAIPVDLEIKIAEGELSVTDKTFFGDNVTKITLGGAEVEKETRGKRKKFMLSAFEDLSSDGLRQVTVKCRLHQRGEGWYSLQSFTYLEDQGILRECYALYRPTGENAHVTRIFRSLEGASDKVSEEKTATNARTSGITNPRNVVLASIGCTAVVLFCVWHSQQN